VSVVLQFAAIIPTASALIPNLIDANDPSPAC
jgi:hypothetical protein